MTRRRAIILSTLAALLGLATTIGVSWVFACMRIRDTGRTSAQRMFPQRGAVYWEPMGGPSNGLNVSVYEDRGRLLVRASAHGPDVMLLPGLPMITNIRPVPTPPDALVPKCVRLLAIPWLSGTPWPRGADRDWREVQASGWPMIALATEHQRAADFSHRQRFAINIGGSRDTGSAWRPSGSPRLLPLLPIWPGILVDTAVFAAIWWVLFAGVFLLRSHRRRRRGLCARCGYDLQHTHRGQLCPECGAIHA